MIALRCLWLKEQAVQYPRCEIFPLIAHMQLVLLISIFTSCRGGKKIIFPSTFMGCPAGALYIKLIKDRLPKENQTGVY